LARNPARETSASRAKVTTVEAAKFTIRLHEGSALLVIV
jgi:hypothetical protein